jgi:hypothetical protein
MEHTMSSRTKKLEKATGGFDLASRYQRETATITILDPVDGTDTGLRWEIKSPQSEEAQKARERFRSTLTIVGDEVKVSAEDAHASLLAQIVAVTVAWWDVNGPSDGIVIGGVVVPCTAEAVLGLCTDPRTKWMFDQALSGYLSVAGFFGASKAA